MKRKLFLTMWLIILSAFVSISFSCSGAGEEKTVVVYQTAPTDPETPINTAEKFYTVSPVETANFYYFTDSGQLKKFSESGVVENITISVTIKQANEIDIIQPLLIDQFFRIGMTIYFSGSAGNKFLFCSQSGGVITIIDESEFPVEPIKNRITMNNGHFSITTGAYGAYEISDVRNLTMASGISRTLYVSAFYIANDYYGQNGMFFVCHDNGVLMPLTSGLYFYPENHMSSNKVIDEEGEMW